MAFDALPTGVRLLPDLVTPAQEAALVAAVDAGAWEEGTPSDGHRVQQFGWWRPQWPGQAGAPDRFLGALPDWAAPLVSRLHVLAPFAYAPDHLVVREHAAGSEPRIRQGQGRTLATLALLDGLPMRFRRREGTGMWHLTQPRRSLLILTERFDEAWDRTILPARETPEAGHRLLSLTFRRVS